MAGTIDRLKGTVTWFDARKGFGFIIPEGGGRDIFVHHSSIMAEGFRALTVGEAVEFVVSEGDDGRIRAVNVTGPGGACIRGSRCFGGVCYRCSEVGHMARDCKKHSAFNSPGVSHCYSNGATRHSVMEYPNTRFEPSTSRDNLLKFWKLDRPALWPQMAVNLDLAKDDIRTLSGCFSECTVSDEKEIPKGTAERNWAELPRDVLSLIFKEIAAVEILSSAQFVCKSWRQLSLEPEIWRCIDMTAAKDSIYAEDPEESMAKLALDRSAGCLEEFYGEYFGNDDLLSYMAERAPQLRCLHLISVSDISDEALVEAVRRFPLLEELWISVGMFSDEVVELLGRARPQLKVFRLSQDHYQIDSDSNVDTKALAIAKHMQQLRRLQLIGNNLTSTGLSAILDGCPYLEHLDIRRCFNVVLDENLMKKCTRVKELRLPNDYITGFLSNPSLSVSEEIEAISSESGREYGFEFDDGASDDDDFFNDGFVDYG